MVIVRIRQMVALSSVSELSQGLCTMFRCDRVGGEDLSHGGVMIVYAPHMMPVSSGIQHHPSLEVVSVLVKHHQLCIVVVYRRPQLSMTTFLPLYLLHRDCQHSCHLLASHN